MTEAQREARLALRSLRKAVREAIERKRRLGQYAVVWRRGRPVRLEGDDLVCGGRRSVNSAG